MKYLNLIIILSWTFCLNFAAGALVYKWMPNFALSKISVVVFSLLLFFFIEHFYGLGGDLSFLFPVVFFVSIFVVYKKRSNFFVFLKKEGVFFLGFIYCFIWRLIYPDIHTGTEHLTDLYFISNYMSGGELPPEDAWYPPTKFDFYYSFQHYAAAFYSRILGISSGIAYNICFALIFGYMGALVWESTKIVSKSNMFAYFMMFVILVGGTGVSPLFDFIKTTASYDQPIVAAMRFIGNSELRTSIAPFFASSAREIQDVPVETFGYLMFIGDYHPPLSAYTVLVIYLSSFFLWIKNQKLDLPIIVMGLCLPLTVVTNTWVFPLLVIFSLFLSCYLVFDKPNFPWSKLWLGFFVGLLLIFPFLSGFGIKSAEVNLLLTPSSQYTPILLLFVQFWPVFIPVFILVFVKESDFKNLGFFFLLGFFAVFLFTEFFYADGGEVGIYNRTNSTMKWWGWVFLLGQVVAGWLLFCQKNKLLKTIFVFVLAFPAVFQAYYLYPYFKQPLQAIDKLNGKNWLVQKHSGMNELIDYLEQAPEGVVLERVSGDVYTTNPAVSIFSSKPTVLGWVSHLWAWGKGSQELHHRKADITKFYSGNMQKPIDWLDRMKVQYIVWGAEEVELPARLKIESQISNAFYWRGFDVENKIGVWIRK